ncbi:MAG: hypothetical protein L3J82_04940 [Planctomycetes bacterium]|nr:hypothetical protein [Planctomycetota bacterium]
MMLIIAAVFIGFSTITIAQDEKPDKAAPAKEDVEKLEALAAKLKDNQAVYDTARNLTIDDIKSYYDFCEVEYRENNKHEGFKKLRDNWAELWIKRSDEARDQEQAKLLMKLSDAGYASAEAKFEQCLGRMMKAGNATMIYKEADTPGLGRIPHGKFEIIVKPTFEKLALRAGWEYYLCPEEFDEFNLWFLDAMEAYWSAEDEVDVHPTLRQMGLLPPASVAKLRAAEKTVFEEAKALKAQDDKDGFAINARQTFHRFKLHNRNGKRFNVSKGRRAFSPNALGRGKVYEEGTKKIVDQGETVDEVWTYTYAKPFIIYVEKPVGGEIDPEYMEGIRQKARLLGQANEWFQSNIVKPIGLTRQLPLGPPYSVRDKDGKMTGSETPAQKAAREEWPLELVFFKDNQSFMAWANQLTGGRMPPGAVGMYSPEISKTVTWMSDDDSGQPNQLNVVMHEVFHQLADHYAANPLDYNAWEPEERLRYSSVLVQEGFTEYIASIKYEEGKLTFGAPNLSRIVDYFATQDSHIGDLLFTRIKDLLSVQYTSQIDQVFRNRAIELKDKLKEKNFHRAFNGSGVGIGYYYAAVCITVQFFNEYEVDGKFPLRKKWLEFIRQDYSGELAEAKKLVDRRVQPDKVIAAFAKVFELESDEDWQKLDDDFWEFCKALKKKHIKDEE